MTRIFGEQFGLLHDVDFECYPEEHCKKAPELLKEIDASDELIHAVCSHGYGICSDVEPTHEMEKILFATDELTGLIWAAAKMRPSNSTKDMEVSSLKKKFKDKKFAAGCSRDVIKEGAEKLGWELNDLFEQTILAMRESEDLVNNIPGSEVIDLDNIADLTKHKNAVVVFMGAGDIEKYEDAYAKLLKK